MQYSANKYVRVSDLSSYAICPRLAYFRFRKESGPGTPPSIHSEIYREISRSLNIVYASDNPQDTLRQVIERACEDIAIIYGFSVDETLAEATGQIGNILAGLERESARLGKDRLAALLRPEAEQVSLVSDKLRLSGKIDRICMPDGRQLPVCVSASAPPENGIYLSDRVKLAAYSLLVSDAYGCEVIRCAMEYMGGWCIREVEIRKADMREALSIRRRIEEGRTAMPDARRGRWCDRCEFKSSCVARVSFLDSLYKQAFR